MASVLVQIDINILVLGRILLSRERRNRVSCKQRAAQHKGGQAAGVLPAFHAFPAFSGSLIFISHFQAHRSVFTSSFSIKIRMQRGPADQPVKQDEQRRQDKDHKHKGQNRSPADQRSELAEHPVGGYLPQYGPCQRQHQR